MLLIREPGGAWSAPRAGLLFDEDVLKMVLVQAPALLRVSPHADLVLVRDFEIPVTGCVDLLGIDTSGDITIAHCSRRGEGETRRDFSGSLLAFAAALWKLPYGEFDRLFAQRMATPLAAALARVAVSGQVDWSEERFRLAVSRNLEAGNFRLLVVVSR
ncbi:MAG: hypothetical protein ACRDV9_12080, partial [Acidimicrobiia bacterium]